MARIDQQLEDEFARSFFEFTDTITRRKFGSTVRTESIEAIVEEDTQAAIGLAGRAGLISQQEGVAFDRGCLVEVAKSQEIDTRDKLVIDGELWDVLGPATGEDAGSKTIICVRREHGKTRRPYIDRSF